MDADRWRHIEELYAAALEIEPGARERFVDEAAGEDRSLADEVQALLAAPATGSFLQPPTAADVQPWLEAREESLVGETIGSYRVLREIASGGMGCVYLAARADEAYEQTVALKLIRGGADRAELLRRFRDERQTLARLNHPNVARLLDGGATPEGEPYIVMEYIAGQPIDAYCDAARLSTRERLRLFCTVCAAVHYAHQNLVIHRDLKPSNILVDAAGVPKLLDFGIAKVLEPDSAAHPSAATQTRGRVMTPEFASPEQVRGEPVTTATDVYSLGVILYELLSGHRPYRTKTGLAHEIERAICEEDVPTPSTAVRRTRELPARGGEEETEVITPESVSTTRGTSPRELQRQLRGDVDTIVLKAMHKEPGRRYASAEQLAEDLVRYLDGMPVLARGDTWRYRAGKFVRRNRLAVAMTLAIFLLLVGGIAGVSRWARVAEIQKGRALAAGVRADHEAKAAQLEAHQARQLSGMLKNLLASADPTRRGPDLLVRELLDEEARSIGAREFVDPVVEAEIRMTIGNTYVRLGVYDQAQEHLKVALDRYRSAHGEEHPDIALVLNCLGNAQLERGSFDEAEGSLLQALEMYERLRPVADHNTATLLRGLAALYRERGDERLAEELFREALAIARRVYDDASLASAVNDLGAVLNPRDLDAAEELFEEALEIARRSLPAEHPSIALYLTNLGDVLWRKGEYRRSNELCTEALRIRRRSLPPDHPSLVQSIMAVERYQRLAGRLDESSRLLKEAIDIQHKALGDRHPDLVHTLISLASVMVQKRDYERAEELAREGLEIAEEGLGAIHPVTARGWQTLGKVLHGQRDLEGSLESHENGLRIRLEHFGEEHSETALSLYAVARLNLDLGHPRVAAELYERALQARRATLPADHPDIGFTLWSLAYTRVELDQHAEAIQTLRECIDLWSGREDGTIHVGMSSRLLGICLTHTGAFEEAEGHLLEARAIFESERGPGHPTTRQTLDALIALYDAWDRPDEARAIRVDLDER